DLAAARAIFERGLAVDPHHAPLFHELAQLEALVGNVEGLARLDRLARRLYPEDVL
ncbi:unnamed protein product, partial [Phaeothamnion confervicola]